MYLYICINSCFVLPINCQFLILIYHLRSDHLKLLDLKNEHTQTANLKTFTVIFLVPFLQSWQVLEKTVMSVPSGNSRAVQEKLGYRLLHTYSCLSVSSDHHRPSRVVGPLFPHPLGFPRLWFSTWSHGSIAWMWSISIPSGQKQKPLKIQILKVHTLTSITFYCSN